MENLNEITNKVVFEGLEANMLLSTSLSLGLIDEPMDNISH
jgi:hypothetical protein